ncbi:hypothetical protein [Stenotrophomonas maltophilia]|uniref:hypothetical protein n=1 Tax=Stenotrophomonas maltophilia TaxID=40324 RepID=UPI0028952AF1|nr:hypothetical protein [Stenotrophomonas maltophilia]MDT3485907.1 hypothetical protein [Stenotrophomonas maltophilia]
MTADESEREFVRNVLASLIEGLEQDPVQKDRFIAAVNKKTTAMTGMPRDGGDANWAALAMLQGCLVARAEALYGSAGRHRVRELPFFMDQLPGSSNRLNSGVFNCGEDDLYGIGIGGGSVIWSDVIYELAHESLHLLDPIADVAVTPVAAIEEGVAVKFAEVVYSEYMRPHGATQPVGSRAVAYDANYRSAYESTRKIPDNDLKRVRAHFGKFSAVTDTAAYRACVDAHVDDEEAQALAAPFVYRQLASRG